MVALGEKRWPTRIVHLDDEWFENNEKFTDVVTNWMNSRLSLCKRIR